VLGAAIRLNVRAGLDSAGSMVLAISDTGIGMAEEEIAIAMQPFGQVDSSLSRRFEGTELGLPLTKAFVEMHGGSLRLESARNSGTTACVVFPPHRVLRHAAQGTDRPG
jgi:signal transduction histidine kinase